MGFQISLKLTPARFVNVKNFTSWQVKKIIFPTEILILRQKKDQNFLAAFLAADFFSYIRRIFLTPKSCPRGNRNPSETYPREIRTSETYTRVLRRAGKKNSRLRKKRAQTNWQRWAIFLCKICKIVWKQQKSEARKRMISEKKREKWKTFKNIIFIFVSVLFLSFYVLIEKMTKRPREEGLVVCSCKNKNGKSKNRCHKAPRVAQKE